MSKSVYSLVLDDEVISAADRLAYQRNLSRSALINQLLAEALSCMTPEKRNRSVFDAVEKWMQPSGLRLQMTPSESVLSVHSTLSYKYNPRIRYAVELYRDSDSIGGELRVSFRSQNQALLEALRICFFRFGSSWSRRIWENIFRRAKYRAMSATGVIAAGFCRLELNSAAKSSARRLPNTFGPLITC